jgi:hypothetical protein
MLFPIVIFLLVLSPLYIPVAVTVVHEFSNWREKMAARPARQFRPAVQFGPAVGLASAAA